MRRLPGGSRQVRRPGVNLVKRPRVRKIHVEVSKENPQVLACVAALAVFMLERFVLNIGGAIVGFSMIGAYLVAGVVFMQFRPVVQPPPKKAAVKKKPEPAPVEPPNPAVLALLRGLLKTDPDLDLDALRGQSVGGFTPASINRAIDYLKR